MKTLGATAGWVAALGLLASIDSVNAGEMRYQFEYFFPVLQQPWYFREIEDLVVDDFGYLYAADNGWSAVYKLNQNGQIITRFNSGSALSAIDIGPDGMVYTAGNQGVDVFTPDGVLVAHWGELGTGPGQFRSPRGLAIDPLSSLVYVADGRATLPPRVQVFTLDGTFTGLSWEVFENSPASCNCVIQVSIALDGNGHLFVADDFEKRVRKFTIDGTLLTLWDEPLVNGPKGIEIVDDTVYVVAGNLARIFDLDGNFLGEWTNTGQSLFAIGAIPGGGFAVGGSGRVETRDPAGDLVSRFSADQAGVGGQPALNANGNIVVGTRIVTPQGQPVADFVFGGPFIVVHPDNTIYSATSTRLAHLQADGTLINQFGDSGNRIRGLGISPDGSRLYTSENPTNVTGEVRIYSDDYMLLDQVAFPEAIGVIAVGPSGQVYLQRDAGLAVLDADLNPVRDLNGIYGIGIAVDAQERIFTTNQQTQSENVEVWDEFGNSIARFGLRGSGAGLFGTAIGVVSDGADTVYVTDSVLDRVQRFDLQAVIDDTRAIIVAGGGPYAGNVLWPATQVNANSAYRALAYQGLTRETIQYLSADLDLDLDENGASDDVDADATVAALQESILGPSLDGLSGFSAGAQQLILFLVDHGGDNTFRVSGTETLTAQDLDGWLDTWQSANPTSRVTVIYDACQSGTFMDVLPDPLQDRVLITSASGLENAQFVSQGALSFSSFFWTHVFNGLSLGNAFNLARQATTGTFSNQNPLLETDGDGIPNMAADLAAVNSFFLVGDGTTVPGDVPVIGDVTPNQQISGTATATIQATGVTDDDGVGRVWVVMRPPGFNPGSPDNPIQDLPTFDLVNIGGGTYEGSYDGFAEVGTWQLSIYASDAIGNIAVPVARTVVVESPLNRRAVIIAGGPSSDPGFTAFTRNADLAFNGLVQQGYGPNGEDCMDADCDDIQFFIDAGLAGVDGQPTLNNIEFAISTWGASGTQDLTVYLIGSNMGGEIRLDDSTTLNPVQLDAYLDLAEQTIPGVVTVIVEADDAETFIQGLTVTSGKTRILVASAGAGQVARLFDDGEVSFSKFFWNHTLNGATVRQSFRRGEGAINFGANPQRPGLDDTGNGLVNELFDGLFSNTYSIGQGVLFAGDNPVIGVISEPAAIAAGSYALSVDEVTSTGVLDSVLAIIEPPGAPAYSQALAPVGDGTWTTVILGLDETDGNVVIAVYATDAEGNTSLPASTLAIGDLVYRSGFE